jgi:hypothetical protein
MSTHTMSTATTNIEEKATPQITRAAERYLEQYGDPLVMNTYLKATILVLGFVCVVLKRSDLQEPASARQHTSVYRTD